MKFLMQILLILGVLLFLLEISTFLILEEKHERKKEKELEEIRKQKPVDLRKQAFIQDKWTRELFK